MCWIQRVCISCRTYYWLWTGTGSFQFFFCHRNSELCANCYYVCRQEQRKGYSGKDEEDPTDRGSEGQQQIEMEEPNAEVGRE